MHKLPLKKKKLKRSQYFVLRLKNNFEIVLKQHQLNKKIYEIYSKK